MDFPCRVQIRENSLRGAPLPAYPSSSFLVRDLWVELQVLGVWFRRTLLRRL